MGKTKENINFSNLKIILLIELISFSAILIAIFVTWAVCSWIFFGVLYFSKIFWICFSVKLVQKNLTSISLKTSQVLESFSFNFLKCSSIQDWGFKFNLADP